MEHLYILISLLGWACILGSLGMSWYRGEKERQEYRKKNGGHRYRYGYEHGTDKMHTTGDSSESVKGS